MLQQNSVSILLLIPCCIEVSHSDLVSLAGPINEQCPGVDPDNNNNFEYLNWIDTSTYEKLLSMSLWLTYSGLV